VAVNLLLEEEAVTAAPVAGVDVQGLLVRVAYGLAVARYALDFGHQLRVYLLLDDDFEQLAVRRALYDELVKAPHTGVAFVVLEDGHVAARSMRLSARSISPLAAWSDASCCCSWKSSTSSLNIGWSGGIRISKSLLLRLFKPLCPNPW
jgi:hypothetical protein